MIYNAHDYTVSELEEMLNLPTNYNVHMIDLRLSEFNNKIMGNDAVSEETKVNVLQFLDEARKILLLKQQQQPPLSLSSSSSPFAPQITPRYRFLKKYLNIDSRFRDQYYSTTSGKFNVKLPFKINNIKDIELASIEMPTTFYAVSSSYGNDFFSIEISSVTSSLFVKCVLQIPSGNYDSKGFLDAINSSSNKQTITRSLRGLNLLSPNLTDDINAIYNSIQFTLLNDNNGTGTSQILVTLSETLLTTYSQDVNVKLIFDEDIQGNITSTALGLKLGWSLGFRRDEYLMSSSFMSITSEGILNVTGPKYLFFVLEDHNNNNNNQSDTFMNAYNSISLNRNILARIPLTLFSIGFQIANKTNFTATPREYTNPITTDEFTLQLLDEYGRQLELNNMNYSCCIALTLRYES
jgi:hypothetical protein